MSQSAEISSEDHLDEVLTAPGPALVDFVRAINGPLVILGAGGKMGPTLAVLARRAADAAGHRLDVVAVSRFADDAPRRWLEARRVETCSADLLEKARLDQLPDASHVVYLVGLKFGTSHDPARTWAVNTLVPAHVVARYARAKIVALSTGNVYPLASAAGPGSVEADPLTPLGEYANAAVARERLFEFCARRHGTPLVLLRLNYAVELRYGVLVDVASKVLAGESVDVAMGYFNCIWQGDANDMILRALALAKVPPLVLNLTGPEVLSVRSLAHRFGELLGKPAQVVGTEASTALLSNPSKVCALLGSPPTAIDQVMRWTADWLLHGGQTLNKPTHFETRDGKY
jgi:nucleoside-diphosphate-sugar epimerase